MEFVSLVLAVLLIAVSGVTLRLIAEVFNGAASCRGATLRTGRRRLSASPSSSSLPSDIVDSISPRLSIETEESNARSADACRPEPGARKEHPKAMAMRSASQQSHILFQKTGLQLRLPALVPAPAPFS